MQGLARCECRRVHQEGSGRTVGLASPLHTLEGFLARPGAWHKAEYGERAAKLGWLLRDSGLVIYQLKTTLSRVDGVHDVEV